MRCQLALAICVGYEAEKWIEFHNIELQSLQSKSKTEKE